MSRASSGVATGVATPRPPEQQPRTSSPLPTLHGGASPPPHSVRHHRSNPKEASPLQHSAHHRLRMETFPGGCILRFHTSLFHLQKPLPKKEETSDGGTELSKTEDICARWRNVSPVGQPIPGTRFIAFKVPLKGAINQRLTPNQKFTPKDLIAAVKALNVELGLIIDLTYTTRYYDVKDLPKNMEYKKLYTVGLEVPDDPTILQFKKWVRKFLWENAENGKLIGVHCTNGINRTGYLICRYLIDVEGWDPETAIQVFGEARGHHMDGSIYLTDLRTQPMRSNLGMNMWDSDGDLIPPPHDMAGQKFFSNEGQKFFPNEEFSSRPGKRLRGYQDGHPHCDLPSQMQIREFDFINKGPGQRRKPYNDHQFQDDIQPLLQIRQRPFPDDQFYDECQEEMRLRDMDFVTRGPGQRPFHDHQFSDNFLGNAPAGDCVNRNHGQMQRHFPEISPYHDKMTDMELNRGCGQKRRPFYDPQSGDELRDPPFFNKGPGQRMRHFHDEMQPSDDVEFFNRGRGQRRMLLIDHQHYSDLRREMPFDHFDNRDAESRYRPFNDHQSYDDFNEEMHSNDYLNRGPTQRMRPFNDNSLHNNVPYEGYLERDQPFPSHEQFPESPLHYRDYGSDDYNRNCRPDCPEDYRRLRPSDETNRGGKTRFLPYPSHSIHHSSSTHQKNSSVSEDYRRGPQYEVLRDMGQGKKSQVVTIDYNYGLPLDGASEEEDRTHYNLPPREYCTWK